MIESNDKQAPDNEPGKIDPDAVLEVRHYCDGRGRKITALIECDEDGESVGPAHFVTQVTFVERNIATGQKRPVQLRFEIPADTPVQAFALFDSCLDASKRQYQEKGRQQILRPGLVFPQ